MNDTFINAEHFITFVQIIKRSNIHAPLRGTKPSFLKYILFLVIGDLGGGGGLRYGQYTSEKRSQPLFYRLRIHPIEIILNM